MFELPSAFTDHSTLADQDRDQVSEGAYGDEQIEHAHTLGVAKDVTEEETGYRLAGGPDVFHGH